MPFDAPQDPWRRRIAELERENAALRATGPRTSAERGHQLRRLVDRVTSELNAAGCYYVYRYRAEMSSAICEELFGNAAVDVPSWPLDRM